MRKAREAEAETHFDCAVSYRTKRGGGIVFSRITACDQVEAGKKALRAVITGRRRTLISISVEAGS